MTREGLADTLDAVNAKVKADITRLQDFNRLNEKLKGLQEQKRRIEADTIMDSYLKRAKTLDEIMTFLSY